MSKNETVRHALSIKLRNAQRFDPPIYKALGETIKSQSRSGRGFAFSLVLAYKAAIAVQRIAAKVTGEKHKDQKNTERFVSSRVYQEPCTAHAVAPGRHVVVIGELSLPQCRRYRIEQKVAVFEQRNIGVTVFGWGEYNAARNALQTASLAIFYRVPGFDEPLQLIDEAKRLGVPTFFDIDDLVFDRDAYVGNANLASLSKRERDHLLGDAALFASAMSKVDYGIASTPTIARYMQRYIRGPIYVMENALDHDHLEIAAKGAGYHPVNNDTVVVGYGSGTRTHDVDYSMIASALEEIMRRHANVRLAIHGTLELPAQLRPYRERIIRVPMLDAESYTRSLSTFDINLAPLTKSDFNEAKSN
ncbi:MAG: hypothetical protein H7Z43_02225, partial [Clostridia bacterium]|nr:hypothetical protein [Deltaproteobacteria bacterium]